MKKLLFVITSFLCVTSAAAGVPAMQSLPPTNPPPIIITPIPPPSKDQRSPQFSPMSCTYVSGSDAIRTTFYENIGEVVIVVVNHTTGEQWMDYADSASGSWDTYLSGSRGDHSIIMETAGGSHYGGTFTL